jgi:hypothetical protein
MTEKQKVWMPPGAKVGLAVMLHILLVIYGKAGVGKSRGVYQLTHDAEWNQTLYEKEDLYGPEDTYVWMAEDATSTYHHPQPIIERVDTVDSLYKSVCGLIQAGKDGAKLPKIGVVDSLSGILDYQMASYNAHPMLNQKGERDKRAEFGNLGEEVTNLMLLLRDHCPIDVVVNVTTHEPGYNMPPELAIPGKVVPKNLTRLSTSALYMKSEPGKAKPEEIAAMGDTVYQPHRTVGKDEFGKFDGNILNRIYLTQDAGEVFAKGHHNLALREKAILPDVLRKIKGITPKEND